MAEIETVIDEMVEGDLVGRIADYDSFVTEVEPLLRETEAGLEIEEAGLQLQFGTAPTAAALARALDETDRQARRVAAGIQRGVRPESLRGRGVRLVPTALGLRVERADPGSLDVVLTLGGLYQVATSQPLSFALNVAALLDYGKAAIRVFRPGRKKPTREITVRLPIMPVRDHEEYHHQPAAEHIPQLPSGEAQVQIPSDYTTVRITMRSAGGDSVEIDCSRDAD